MKNPFFIRAFAIVIGCLTIGHGFANSVVLNAHGGQFPAYPTVNYGSGTNADLIKKGEYLAKMGDCIACHTDTKNDGKPYAGGLPFDTPFGIFYSPNITPDKATGIGNWSIDDFKQALHEGLSPTGANYYPVFPYVYFNRLNDSDILALKTYFDNVPPVHQRNRKNSVAFPFNIRFLQSGWKLLFFDFHKGQYQPDTTKSKEWNRGAYIVKGLGHCGMCHTPLNIFGAEKIQLFLGGAFVAGGDGVNNYYAPNITSATLGNKNVAEIMQVFTKDKMLDDAGQVQGPMLEVDHDSLRFLSQEDLTALATYLKTVKPVKQAIVKATGSDEAVGKQIYESKCTTCHDTGAAGAPKRGDIDAWKPRIAQGMDVLYTHALNGFNSMPPKGTCMTCTDQQIKDAVMYLVSQSKAGGGTTAKSVSTAPAPIDTSFAKGKKVYEESCAMCHANGKYGAPVFGNAKAWQPRLDQGMATLMFHAIHGYNNMPAKGACIPCTNVDIIAAVKYMTQQSGAKGNNSLW